METNNPAKIAGLSAVMLSALFISGSWAVLLLPAVFTAFICKAGGLAAYLTALSGIIAVLIPGACDGNAGGAILWMLAAPWVTAYAAKA